MESKESLNMIGLSLLKHSLSPLRLGMVMVFAHCLLGCTSVKETTPQYRMADVPKTITLDMAGARSRSILLEENATTGYMWAASYDKEQCKVNVEHLSPANNGMVGVPGQARVTLTLLGDKETVVTLKYMRSWETKAPAKVVEVVIRPN